jgi:hypothetical protein
MAHLSPTAGACGGDLGQLAAACAKSHHRVVRAHRRAPLLQDRPVKPAPALFAALAFAVCAALPARAFELVTADEAKRDAAAPDYATKSLPMPGAPSIELLSPDVKRPLTGAVNIVVRWSASDGAAIDLSTFRVLYGRLRLDVTERLAAHAKVTPSGVEAPDAKLPEGSHRLVIQVADTLKRVGRQEVNFEVAPAKP